MIKETIIPEIEAKSEGLKKTLLVLDKAFTAQADHLEKLIENKAIEPFDAMIIDEAFKLLDRIDKLKKFDDIYQLVFNPKPASNTKGKKTLDLETQAEPEKDDKPINHMENVLDKVKSKINGKKDG